jgi:hypothetical protein
MAEYGEEPIAVDPWPFLEISDTKFIGKQRETRISQARGRQVGPNDASGSQVGPAIS